MGVGAMETSAMSRVSFGLPEALQTYVQTFGVRPTAERLALRDATNALENASMQISIEQGEFMHLLLKLIGARHCLEVGTFTGYSALVTAEALPADGKLVCCDISAEYPAIGRPMWEAAGIADKIDLRIGPAVDTLDTLLAEGRAGSFDFCFIDADKPNYDAYYERALRLVRPGGVIGIDNTLWYAKVVDPEVNDPDTVAIREINEKVHADPRVEMVLLPIGDGLTLCRVL
jgi:predicted O-methyltransferase YrrM